jgi:hypothetical protein
MSTPSARNIAFVILFFLAALPAPAAAQGLPREPDQTTVPVRFGPLWMNPTVSLTNAGIDENVFNEADADSPERDFTLTVTPASDVWLRMGRTWLAGVVREDLVWYREFAGERGANGNYTLGWIVPLTRISFNVGGNWVDTRERPGFEIDARSNRQERAFLGNVEVRALSKTLVGVRGERRKIDFDRDETFLGTNLQEALARTQTTGTLTIRHELTPLTHLTLDVGRASDRFTFSPLRDSDSNQIAVGFSFDPQALISGRAQVGFRRFTPLDRTVPRFSGGTAAVDLAYTALESTRMSVQLARDLQYSFEPEQPYYLQTGIRAAIGQQIYGPVDVEARAGRQRLAYRERSDAAAGIADRVDHVVIFGGGAGYRLGRAVRVGFNIDRHARSSELDRRNFNGLRYGMALTYGL